MVTVPEKIVLYGTGLEGEKFYCLHHKSYEIMYCLDKRKRDDFHNKKVYTLEEMKEYVNGAYIIVAAKFPVYEEIKKELETYGFEEYKDFLHSDAVGKKIVFVYGNCHIREVLRYLNRNYEFAKSYYSRLYYIALKEAPAEELSYCDLLITQDIRKDNYLGQPSCDELVRKHIDGVNIIVPNLYGCNMFFPQVIHSGGVQKAPIDRHFLKEAIDMNTLGESAKSNVYNFNSMLIGAGDAYIDEMFHKGETVEEIKNGIMEKQIWSEEYIRNNFEDRLEEIRKRERHCSFQISNYIEDNYKKCRLFYSPRHPTGVLTKEKGKRILELLGIKADMEEPFDNGLGGDELPIYGCVKRALGLEYEQTVFRRVCRCTLDNRPENLEEYIAHYIAWSWE